MFAECLVCAKNNNTHANIHIRTQIISGTDKYYENQILGIRRKE